MVEHTAENRGVAGSSPALAILSSPDLKSRFRALHADGIFVMPNPWDVGSAKLLASMGFEALATTSAGLAWSLGKLDMQVTRDELVEHVAAVAAATPLPLNVDSERCFPDEPGGVAETVRLLADAGAAGCSIEDFDPATGEIELARRRGRARGDRGRGRAARRSPPAPRITSTASTISTTRSRGSSRIGTRARMSSTRRASADLAAIRRVVEEVGVPVNVLALPVGPSVSELGAAGVRRVSTGGALARAAYGALLAGAAELRDEGTSRYSEWGAAADALKGAFGRR